MRGENFIENPVAYEAAKEERIKENRRIGNRRRWVAESGEEIVAKCSNFLTERGEFCSRVSGDRYVPNPLVKASQGDFFRSMNKSLEDWGRLTKGQENAVLKMIERAAVRIEEQKNRLAEEGATKQWIGEIGVRQVFDLVIKFVACYEGDMGLFFVNVMEDDNGNCIVYKGGKSLGGKGEKIRIKATVKEHGSRDGIKQTIVSRPAVA
jgi:hypothetical protein